jgi:hypothetical protein
MNTSANTSNLQGDPNWATVNWDQSGATGSLDQTTCQYTANRSEWLDCDPMILAQHPGSGCSSECGDGDCKSHLTHAGELQEFAKNLSPKINMQSCCPCLQHELGGNMMINVSFQHEDELQKQVQ